MTVNLVNKTNFQETVIQSDKPVLIDLWATWCGPCRMMSPVIEEFANTHPEVKVCKINVDEDPELAQTFQVSAIPMLVLVEGGKVKRSSVGYIPKEQIEKMLG